MEAIEGDGPGRIWAAEGGIFRTEDWDEPRGGGGVSVRLWLCDRSGACMLALDLRFAKPKFFRREFKELIWEEE